MLGPVPARKGAIKMSLDCNVVREKCAVIYGSIYGCQVVPHLKQRAENA